MLNEAVNKMKKTHIADVFVLFVVFLSLCAFCQEGATENGVKELKVLMIGNSFSQSVLTYLPKLVDSDKTVALRLRQAYIGGCTIERHLREYDRAKKVPSHRPYTTNLELGNPSGPAKKKSCKANLQEMLSDGKYDIVTIQQGSGDSWKPETYQADADRLISIVREYQPQAEIVVHETWAYRCDAPRLIKWKIDQAEMHRLVSSSYKGLASRHGFRMIPVGDAVDIFRKQVEKPYKPLSSEERAALSYPKLPDFSGDVVGKSRWDKKKNGDGYELYTDYIHLNKNGAYLQACVWYMVLFGKKGADIKYVPDDMSQEQCRLLVKCAELAVNGNK